MFIYLTDDTLKEFLIQQKEKIGSQEEVKELSEDCFRGATDERVTFYGHGSVNSFGGLEDGTGDGETAESFVNKLKQYGLPPTVKTIDLIGCSIGLRVDPQISSYPQQVAKLLEQEADKSYAFFHNIQVRAFQEDNLLNQYSVTTILTSTYEERFFVQCFNVIEAAQDDHNEKIRYQQVERILGKSDKTYFDTGQKLQALSEL